MKLFTKCLFLLLFLFSSVVFAQQTSDRITGFFPGVSLVRFMELTEKETSFRFYFKESDVEGISVNLQATNDRLEDVLGSIFLNTDLKFSISKTNEVYISKGQKLTVDFPDSFFSQSTGNQSTASLGNEDEFVRNRRYVIGVPSGAGTTAKIRGQVISLEKGEPIQGAIVYEKLSQAQTITDKEGRFELSIPKGNQTILVQNIGGYTEQRLIDLQGDGELNMSIGEGVFSLSEVVVRSGALTNVSRPEMGVQSLTVQQLRKLPAVMGEVDILKGILTMPGVNTAGEASVGFNVRGGAADQNLILYDQNTLFNPSHLFGFFSSVNSDMVQGVELYKAGIPASLGGRLSSVLQVTPKLGRTDKIGGSGGIGPLTSRLSLDGPLGEKTTFIVGGRMTYSDWLLDYLEDRADLGASRAFFADFNGTIEHQLNEKNILRLTGYYSQDEFQFDPDTVYSYSNQNYALSWTHYFNDQVEATFSVGQDAYDFQVQGEDNPLNSYRYNFDIRQRFIKAQFRQEKGDKHIFSYGVHSIWYDLNPGEIAPFGAESIVIPDKVASERALETSLFFGDEFEVNDQLTVSGGLRYNLYGYFGPQTLPVYASGEPNLPQNITGEQNFNSGELVKTYHGPEFRLSGRYALTNWSSIKAGVNTMRQNIHLLSNSSVITPTDTWKLSDAFIAPQRGIQYALGYFQNLKNNTIEFSAEVYYRSMQNLLDYRSGASIVLNDRIEQDVLVTKGRAYGLELFLLKSTGKLNGSIAYTYSRSLLQTDPSEGKEQINRSEWYPSNFDQPHNANIVLNYELSRRLNTTLAGKYSTGRPVTLPVAKFEYGGSERVYFGDRNSVRIPDYFRLDFSVNLEGNHKVKKLAHASWSFGVYNILGRDNPYSVYYIPEGGKLQGYKLSIFAEPIPFITYNFRF
ncbi:TonB-dependent receptor [Algoriphagus boritolerans]|uniref:Outer membrane receptor for ferrienterochelin and colicins n=1 Tax=Algoriphagus boritolerans DSM 17298 = JCM 18970 TaxID=1120964 RepID=A0A1H5T5K5_9BACT|nr:carboxypeptidase-like regulatory domain-containing protein [Algoriphagus boritolerans]SEF57448.1 Outer membrane receptor for ferrienterochelin and colicins [Algoriphagus boritolerans DSM 17298 = JCM 18970]